MIETSWNLCQNFMLWLSTEYTHVKCVATMAYEYMDSIVAHKG
jgi:hypothetical protein